MAVSYEDICAERRAQFRERVASFPNNDELAAWVEQMTARHGNTRVKVWANELPWLDALGVVRYGEAIDFWPTRFSGWSDDDIRRAYRWLDRAETPNGVTYLPRVEG